MDKSVFVLRLFDGVEPSRVAAITLATDRYEATDAFEEWLLKRGIRMEETHLDVAEAMEDDSLEGIFKV